MGPASCQSDNSVDGWLAGSAGVAGLPPAGWRRGCLRVANHGPSVERKVSTQWYIAPRVRRGAAAAQRGRDGAGPSAEAGQDGAADTEHGEDGQDDSDDQAGPRLGRGGGSP